MDVFLNRIIQWELWCLNLWVILIVNIWKLTCDFVPKIVAHSARFWLYFSTYQMLDWYLNWPIESLRECERERIKREREGHSKRFFCLRQFFVHFKVIPLIAKIKRQSVELRITSISSFAFLRCSSHHLGANQVFVATFFIKPITSLVAFNWVHQFSCTLNSANSMLVPYVKSHDRYK